MDIINAGTKAYPPE